LHRRCRQSPWQMDQSRCWLEVVPALNNLLVLRAHAFPRRKWVATKPQNEVADFPRLRTKGSIRPVLWVQIESLVPRESTRLPVVPSVTRRAVSSCQIEGHGKDSGVGFVYRFGARRLLSSDAAILNEILIIANPKRSGYQSLNSWLTRAFRAFRLVS
jgi:hypothetical protein